MTSVKDKILDAMVAYENSRPRSQQVGLGPSELGGCREYMRNTMIGTPRQSADVWPTAAVVGTLVGEYVESVCATHLDALTQVTVTTKLPNGLQVSGHADVVLIGDNCVVDGKTKNQLHEVLRDGASLENKIQISVYALGLVQMGVLTEGCTANLVYVDRSGTQQFLHEIILSWEDIQGYVELCIERMNDVIEAQEHIDQGEVEYARDLRDKTPPFCYSERVLCPFRDMCWKGSDWVPSERITDPEIIALVESYAAVRDDAKAQEILRKEYRTQLEGVSGLTTTGYAVTWAGSAKSPALYVTFVGVPE